MSHVANVHVHGEDRRCKQYNVYKCMWFACKAVETLIPILYVILPGSKSKFVSMLFFFLYIYFF